MKFLHTMVRVTSLDESMDFYCNKLGLKEVHRIESEAGRFSLVYLSAPEDEEKALKEQAPLIELTYNWPDENGNTEKLPTSSRNWGHLAFRVDDIYETCQKLMDQGVTINRPPRDGYMAFLKSPDDISIELLQKGEPLAPSAPWKDMENIGSW
ncbi:VOC family protein [Halobacteriovorax sp. XZX-3]|uniref:VOC family protein n=1 Tax=unclassified Halobacteriovorax TaxID=2639665 RepID=UPI000CD05697|nr:VOC family protein [Halobacteriovorax sp. DA5]POB12560.1 lactoylglutathione lyase [Halobacteriovorax sp. DA5]